MTCLPAAHGREGRGETRSSHLVRLATIYRRASRDTCAETVLTKYRLPDRVRDSSRGAHAHFIQLGDESIALLYRRQPDGECLRRREKPNRCYEKCTADNARMRSHCMSPWDDCAGRGL